MKPVEELIGDNRGIVRMILGSDVHCAASVLDAARAVFRRMDRQKRRAVPQPLRRGLVLCIIETHRENAKTYFQVMNGRIRSDADVQRICKGRAIAKASA